MEALQKKIILPVSITADPKLLGKSFPILLRKLSATIHLPLPSPHSDKVGISAPLLPPTPYENGVLRLMDKDTEGAWLQWGTNSGANGGRLSTVSIGGVILTLEGEYKSINEIRKILNDIDSKFLEWYRIFASWLDLMSRQDLNEAESDSFISKNTMSELWSVRYNKHWTNAGPDVIHLTMNVKTNVEIVTEAMILEAIARANIGELVSFQNKLLMDARHRFNREDFNGCCLYYGQYIEVTARYKLRDYLDGQGTNLGITNAFLENKALFDLLDSCKKFSIDMNLSNRQRAEVCKIRNLTTHARQDLTLHYAQEMETYANNVFEVSKPAQLNS